MRFSEASQIQEFGATGNLFILYNKVAFLCAALLKLMSPSTGRTAALGSCGQSRLWAGRFARTKGGKRSFAASALRLQAWVVSRITYTRSSISAVESAAMQK